LDPPNLLHLDFRIYIDEGFDIGSKDMPGLGLKKFGLISRGFETVRMRMGAL